MSNEAEWQKLAKHIQDSLSTQRDVAIEKETPLISSGLVDSFSVALLARQVESTFGVRIPAKDMLDANFETIAAIQRLVEALGG